MYILKISELKIKVRYAETDQMGVVYHGNYLIYLELGRTQLIEDLGFNYAEMEADGILAPITDVQMKYKTPLKYGDTAYIYTWIEEYDGLRVTYGYEVKNDQGEVAATGFTKNVCVKKENFRPISIRRKYPDWHEAYEKAKKKSDVKEGK